MAIISQSDQDRKGSKTQRKRKERTFCILAVVSPACVDQHMLEVFLKGYLPHVWILKDPHYSLDSVHCDALLETAETCRRTKREKSAVGMRRGGTWPDRSEPNHAS